MEDNAAILHSAGAMVAPSEFRACNAVVSGGGETRPIFLSRAGRRGEREWECWPHFNK